MPGPPPAARTVPVGHVGRVSRVSDVDRVPGDPSVASVVEPPAGQEETGPG